MFLNAGKIKCQERIRRYFIFEVFNIFICYLLLFVTFTSAIYYLQT